MDSNNSAGFFNICIFNFKSEISISGNINSNLFVTNSIVLFFDSS